MAGKPFEIAGAHKRTEKGNNDWYYGGGDTGYPSITDAYDKIPSPVREGKLFGVWEIRGGVTVLVEYKWVNKNALGNGDEVEVGIGGGGGGNASIDDATITTDKTWSSFKIDQELDNKVDKEAGKGLSENNYSDADKNKVDSLSLTFLGNYSTLAALQASYPTAAEGQFAKAGDNYYRWSSNLMNYELDPTGGDTFDSDFTIKLPSGKSFGKFVNNDVVPAQGKSSKQVILMAGIEYAPAQYSLPTASLAIDKSSSNLEVGETVAVGLDGSFIQNDAGAITSLSVRKNSVEISATEPYTDNIVVGTVPVSYDVVYNYAQGPVKNDNEGNPDPSGRIPSGSITSSPKTLRAYYRSFYGPISAIPTNSAQARSLPGNRLENGAQPAVNTLNTGIIEKTYVIIAPPGLSLLEVKDEDATNMDITSEYALINNNFTVNTPGGTPVSGYKLYAKTAGIPYTANHRHNFRLG